MRGGRRAWSPAACMKLRRLTLMVQSPGAIFFGANTIGAMVSRQFAPYKPRKEATGRKDNHVSSVETKVSPTPFPAPKASVSQPSSQPSGPRAANDPRRNKRGTSRRC